MTNKPNFILDVDGVLTDGKFLYDSQGKQYKEFGADDADALNLVKHLFNIYFVSADKRGFDISKRRVEDMGFTLELVSSNKRIEWMVNKFGSLKNCIYMADGLYDAVVFNEKELHRVAPANAFLTTKMFADIVTQKRGGEGAVAEAIFSKLLDRYYLGIYSNLSFPERINKLLKEKKENEQQAI